MARGPKPFIQTVVWKYVNKGFAKAKQQVDAFRSASSETAEAADDMADSTRAATGVIDRMKDSSNAAVRGLGQMAAKLRAAATSARIWVAAGVATSVAAFATAVGVATSKAVGFENALNEARKTAGLTEQEFQSLASQLLEVQAELGTSQQDLAAIAAEAGRLGIEGPDNIAEFTRTVSLMSEATNVTADQAAQGLARVANAFGLPISRAKALGSVLNELSNQTVASTGDLIDALTRVGAAGNQIGLTADEVAGLAATLIDAGVTARRAGTGLRTIFTRLLNETDKVADQMGVTREELLRTFEEDGVRAVKMYLQSLEEMEKAQRAAAIEDVFGVEQSQKVQALVQNLGNMEKQIADAGQEMKEVDSLTAEFATTTQDVANEWNRLTAKLSAWVTDWGTEFTGYLEEALSFLNDMSGNANELARDLTTASERAGRIQESMALVDRFERLKEEGKDTSEVVEEMQSRFSDDFFREGADGVEVLTGRLRDFLTQQQRMADTEVESRQREAVRALNQAYIDLQRAESNAASADDIDDWREYRKEIQESRKQIKTLSAALVGEFAEGGEVARDELQSFLEDVDLRGFIDTEEIDENIELLIRKWRAYREAKEDAAGAPDPTDDTGDGSDDSDLPDIGEVDSEPLNFDVQQAAEQTRTLQDAAQQAVSSEQFRGVNDVIADYNRRLRDLRLQLEQGKISQEEFGRQAEQAARQYRQELINLLNVLEEAGLITEDMKERAVTALEDMGDRTEETKENTQDLSESLQDLARTTRGIADVAEATGLIGEEARDAINGVSSLLDNVSRLVELSDEAGGFASIFSSFGGAVSGIGAITGAIGGIAQIISMAGDSGPSDEELRRQIQNNVDALQENTEALYESSLIGGDLSEDVINEMQSLVNALQEKGNDEEELLELSERLPQTSRDETKELVDRINQTDLAQFLAIITDESESSMRGRISQLLGGVDPDVVAEQSSLSSGQAEDLQAVIRDMVGEDFDFFDERVERLAGSFGDFGDSLDGVIEELDFRREELGASFEQLRDTLVSRLGDIGVDPALEGALKQAINDATPDELQELEKGLSEVAVGDKELQDVLQNEFTGFLGPTLESNLGELSPKQFREFVNQLSTVAGAEGGSGGRDTNVTSQVQRTITEFQANQLLSWQQEQALTQRSMETHLAAIRSILAQDTGVQPSQSALTTLSTSDGSSPASGISEATFYVNADMSAEEVATKLEEAIATMN